MDDTESTLPTSVRAMNIFLKPNWTPRESLMNCLGSEDLKDSISLLMWLMMYIIFSLYLLIILEVT